MFPHPSSLIPHPSSLIPILVSYQIRLTASITDDAPITDTATHKASALLYRDPHPEGSHARITQGLTAIPQPYSIDIVVGAELPVVGVLEPLRYSV